MFLFLNANSSHELDFSHKKWAHKMYKFNKMWAHKMSVINISHTLKNQNTLSLDHQTNTPKKTYSLT